MTVKAMVERDFYSEDFRLYIKIDRLDGSSFVVTALQVSEYTRYAPTPPFQVPDGAGWSTRDLLQAVLDAAWDVGLRPMASASQTDTLEATRLHLADMRAMAFAHADVKPPEAPR